MDRRKVAAILVAGLALGLAKAPPVSAAPQSSDVTVTGQRIDAKTQRLVSYADLNLSFAPDQRVLRSRIVRTAHSLCFELHRTHLPNGCSRDAVESTKSQVAAAIERAELQMAGKPVGPAIAISMVIGGR